jgi:hypothetical protein
MPSPSATAAATLLAAAIAAPANTADDCCPDHDAADNAPTQRLGVIGHDGECRLPTDHEIARIRAAFDNNLPPDRRTIASRGRADDARTGLDVQFSLAPDVAANPDFVAALQAAATIWEDLIADDATLLVEVDFTSGAGFIAAAQRFESGFSYTEARNALADDAADLEADYVNALPASPPTFQGTFGDFTPSTSPTATDISITFAQAQALGFPDQSPGNAADSGITFNTDFPFDTDPSDGTLVPPDAVDVVYVMLHELGHALGFVSTVDAGFFGGSEPTALDFFRVGEPGASQDPDNLATFTTVERIVAQGTEAAIDPIDQFPEVQSPSFNFSTGSFFGDGRQGSHWKDQSALGLNSVIGVMDPTFESGAGINILDPISEADLLAFSLIGWDIAVPGDTFDTCPDVAGDNGTVDLNDLLLVLSNFGTQTPDGDTNNDDEVDLTDLLAVLSAFGTDCP